MCAHFGIHSNDTVSAYATTPGACAISACVCVARVRVHPDLWWTSSTCTPVPPLVELASMYVRTSAHVYVATNPKMRTQPCKMPQVRACMWHARVYTRTYTAARAPGVVIQNMTSYENKQSPSVNHQSLNTPKYTWMCLTHIYFCILMYTRARLHQRGICPYARVLKPKLHYRRASVSSIRLYERRISKPLNSYCALVRVLPYSPVNARACNTV